MAVELDEIIELDHGAELVQELAEEDVEPGCIEDACELLIVLEAALVVETSGSLLELSTELEV